MTNKQELLNSFGEAYEFDGLPPLTGKIMGLFYISDKKYFSFEEIIEEVNVSKGAVSKTLKLLIQLKRVAYINDSSNSRKRLFYLDISGIIYYLTLVLDNYKRQDDLLKECLKLRTSENEELNKFIKNSMKFNADVLAEINKKMNEHFKY